MKVVLCLTLLVAAALASDVVVDYADQDSWDGACNTGGTAQSPVDVVVSERITGQGTLLKLSG